MIVACISDTHGRSFTIPECDLFIHAGDITAGGSLRETALFSQWINKQKQAKRIVIVPGNHDKCFEFDFSSVSELFEDRINILINQSLRVDGINIWGSPYTLPFMDWYFMADEDRLREIYDSMPGNIDILITHGPPYGILDPGWKEPHVGSKSLLAAVASRTGHIKHHVFGHLHGAGGKSWFNYPYGPHFHNVAACNEAYQLVNQPMLLEI